jgi:hypothetical protein
MRMQDLWIPLTEQKPPKGMTVLVWDTKYQTTIKASIGNDVWKCFGGYKCSFKYGTHWMHIVGPEVNEENNEVNTSKWIERTLKEIRD